MDGWVIVLVPFQTGRSLSFPDTHPYAKHAFCCPRGLCDIVIWLAAESYALPALWLCICV